MRDVLRGTVYIVVEGVPVRREILAFHTETPEDFKRAAHDALPHLQLEFGPIGPPWGLLGA